MKRVLSLLVAGGLLLIPFAGLGQAQQAAPPVAQTLVREGDFAIKLAEALKLGQAQGEARLSANGHGICVWSWDINWNLSRYVRPSLLLLFLPRKSRLCLPPGMP